MSICLWLNVGLKCQRNIKGLKGQIGQRDGYGGRIFGINVSRTLEIMKIEFSTFIGSCSLI